MLIVNVVDVNDEPPRFTEPSYYLTVTENLPSGTQLGRVVAFDADRPPNNRHTFRLDVTSELADLFSVDLLTGVIYTQRALDRELADSYQLTVVVTGLQPISQCVHPIASWTLISTSCTLNLRHCKSSYVWLTLVTGRQVALLT